MDYIKVLNGGGRLHHSLRPKYTTVLKDFRRYNGTVWRPQHVLKNSPHCADDLAMNCEAIALIGAAGALFGMCAYLYRRSNRPTAPGQLMPVARAVATEGFDPNERPALEHVEAFARRIEGLRTKIDLVEEHSGEYFYVLHDRGWVGVVKILEQLELALHEAKALMARGRFDEAQALAAALCSNDFQPTPELLRTTSTDLEALRRWEPEAHHIITCVATELVAAAQNTKELGVSRSRKRQPTLVAMDQLLKLLSGNERRTPQYKQW